MGSEPRSFDAPKIDDSDNTWRGGDYYPTDRAYAWAGANHRGHGSDEDAVLFDLALHGKVLRDRPRTKAQQVELERRASLDEPEVWDALDEFHKMHPDVLVWESIDGTHTPATESRAALAKDRRESAPPVWCVEQDPTPGEAGRGGDSFGSTTTQGGR